MSNDAHFSRPRKSAAEANTERGKNGIIHAMKNRDKSALALALAIVGGIVAGLRCDASEWIDNSSQYAIGGAAYTVKTYTEGSDPFVPWRALCWEDTSRGYWTPDMSAYKGIKSVAAPLPVTIKPHTVQTVTFRTRRAPKR